MGELDSLSSVPLRMSAWSDARKQAAGERDLHLPTTATAFTTPSSSFARPTSTSETPMDYRASYNGTSQVRASSDAVCRPPRPVLYVVVHAIHTTHTRLSYSLQVKRKLEMDAASQSGRVRRRLSSTCSSEELRKFHTTPDPRTPPHVPKP